MAKRKYTAEEYRGAAAAAGGGVDGERQDETASVPGKRHYPEQTYYRWRQEYGGLKLEQAKRLKELEKENSRLKRLVAELSLGKQILQGGHPGKLVSPERRRCAARNVRRGYTISERHVCQLLGQWHGAQRCTPNSHQFSAFSGKHERNSH